MAFEHLDGHRSARLAPPHSVDYPKCRSEWTARRPNPPDFSAIGIVAEGTSSHVAMVGAWEDGRESLGSPKRNLHA